MQTKKITILFLSLLFLSGCATYKFHHGQEPYDKGYVASRDDYTILEYTVGKDNSVPNKISLAKERFKKRREIVEDYYKKMGYIENRFKMAVWDPPIIALKFIGGIFRLPFVAASDYRYDHNPVYRARIDKMEQEKDAREQARINKLKEELSNYIQKQLASEGPVVTAPETESNKPKVEVLEKKTEQIEQKPVAIEREIPAAPPAPQPVTEKQEAPQSQPLAEVLQKPAPSPVEAVIIAKPKKGFSPLTVHFYGSKSRSPGAKIISYFWDFGDGDASKLANPKNTYYSSSFEPALFNVTLTVRDSKGNTATANTTIEVLNK